jgi:hypothetical protein
MPKIIYNNKHVANFLHGPNKEFMGIIWVNKTDNEYVNLKIENYMYNNFPGGTIIPNTDYTIILD